MQIFSQANTPLKKWLLDLAFRRKEAELHTGVVRKDSMWDKLIFKKVQVTRTSALVSDTSQSWPATVWRSFKLWFKRRRVWVDECDWWSQVLHPCPQPSSRSCEQLWAVRWGCHTSASRVLAVWLFYVDVAKTRSRFHSFTKATDKLNVQLGAPCRCQGTGQPVTALVLSDKTVGIWSNVVILIGLNPAGKISQYVPVCISRPCGATSALQHDQTGGRCRDELSGSQRRGRGDTRSITCGILTLSDLQSWKKILRALVQVSGQVTWYMQELVLDLTFVFDARPGSWWLL